MSTDPATWKITDSHAHFFSHDFFKALLEQRAGSQTVSDGQVTRAVTELGLEAPPTDAKKLATRWVSEMDRHGVHQIVLMASVPQDWPSVAVAIRAHPKRIAGYTIVDPLAETALETVDRALGEAGLKGICLFPAMHRYHVYDPPACEVIKVARKYGAVVFCHFGVLKIPIRTKLGLSSPFDGTYAVPTDLHRVAIEFPDVIFQIPHFGAGYLREVMMLGAQCPNVVVDTSSTNSWMDLVGPPLELTTVIRIALDTMGPGRILWGSDSSVFPRGWRHDLFDRQVTCFQSLGCSDDTLRAIFGGNARRLLRLD